MLQDFFQANPVVLANKSREKLRTLTDYAHTRTVREDIFVLNICPLPFGGG
jgi:hypothetical protein